MSKNTLLETPNPLDDGINYQVDNDTYVEGFPVEGGMTFYFISFEHEVHVTLTYDMIDAMLHIRKRLDRFEHPVIEEDDDDN